MKQKRAVAVELSPCQLVAWNLEAFRRERGWTQGETVRRLEPYLGYRLSRPAFSQWERSIDQGKPIHRFDADEIVALARVFDVHVAFFFQVPESHFQGRPVVVNGKPGKPAARVTGAALLAREMTALSGKAMIPGPPFDLSGLIRFLWKSAFDAVKRELGTYLRERPAALAQLATDSDDSEGIRQEILARISEMQLSPAQESAREEQLLRSAGKGAGIETEGKR
jgi:hypothetical protein